jgi:hypothetical protein
MADDFDALVRYADSLARPRKRGAVVSNDLRKRWRPSARHGLLSDAHVAAERDRDAAALELAMAGPDASDAAIAALADAARRMRDTLPSGFDPVVRDNALARIQEERLLAIREVLSADTDAETAVAVKRATAADSAYDAEFNRDHTPRLLVKIASVPNRGPRKPTRATVIQAAAKGRERALKKRP